MYIDSIMNILYNQEADMTRDAKFDALTQTICNKMDLIRLKKGLTQREVADRMERYPSQISALLNGDYGQTVRILHMYAEAMDCDLEVSFVDRSVKRTRF